MTRANRNVTTISPQEADRRIKRLWGYSGREEADLAMTLPFPQGAIDKAVLLIDGDPDVDGSICIPDLIAGWVKENIDGKNPGGRPTSIPPRTFLIIMLMHAIATDDLSISEMAESLTMRVTLEQRVAIGLPPIALDSLQWYLRLQDAFDTLVDLVNSYPYPKYERNDPTPITDRINRHRKLTAKKRRQLEKFRKKMAPISAVKQARLDDLMFQINANLIRRARDEITGFNGDIALDATLVRVAGKPNNPNRLDEDARSTNLEAGAWVRNGNHNGDNDAIPMGKKKFGYEADIVTMTVGDKAIPELILGVNMHRPSAIRDVARSLFPRIATLGLDAGTISVDRAYNGLKTQNFHAILLQHGYEFAFDYKWNQLGQKHFFVANGVRYIMVDGSWYLSGMPQDLVNAVKDARRKRTHPERISKTTMRERIAAREAYRLKPWGTRKPNGDQRYELPDRDGYILFDRDDPQTLLPKPTVRTVTIPLSEGLKWAQKHPFQSPEWKAAFNLRSAVERKNSTLKAPRFEDLDNAAKRPFRGYAWHAIAVSMLIVAHNIRVLDNHSRILEGLTDPRNKHRLTRDRKSRNDGSLGGVQKQRDGRRAA